MTSSKHPACQTKNGVGRFRLAMEIPKLPCITREFGRHHERERALDVLSLDSKITAIQ